MNAILPHKVVGLERAAKNVAVQRAVGRRIVLCHGVFDLLHIGHIKHLQASREPGDTLVVSVTGDRFVNKGPDRPAFKQELRAEALAALECVDWVIINDAPTAEPVIAAIKPDLFVKGSEYGDESADVTGKISSERQAVETAGGKLILTNEVTFSSSALINKYLTPEPMKAFLEDFKSRGGLNRCLSALERLKDLRVLMVGDSIIDEYIYVKAMGKTPKENMVATLKEDRESFAGGVIAAANHLSELVKEVRVITSVGTDPDRATIFNALKPNVKIDAIHRHTKPTTKKTRFIETGYSMRKIFEVYDMDDSPLSLPEVGQLHAKIEAKLTEYDLVIVTDFGHGLISDTTINLLSLHNFLAVNAQTNSANIGFNLITRYRKPDYVCIDMNEARLALGDKSTPISEIAGRKLPERIECPNVAVTKGKDGCVVWSDGSGLQDIPALTGSIVDTVGAGDAFFAVTAPLVYTGAEMDVVGFLGNAAGALKVGIVGHRSAVEKAPLVKFITSILK